MGSRRLVELTIGRVLKNRPEIGEMLIIEIKQIHEN
jgi:hypothetical protein